jgi:hypothetical protein
MSKKRKSGVISSKVGGAVAEGVIAGLLLLA